MNKTYLIAILALIDARYCDLATEIIIDTADTITPDDANAIMTRARTIDPTESNHAAHIRDALRDNTELTI